MGNLTDSNNFRKAFFLLFTSILLILASSMFIDDANAANITATGTIEQAIANANSNDVIQLEEGRIYQGTGNKTITLTTAKNNLTFRGLGSGATLDAQNSGKFFTINSGVTVTFINIHFTNASASGDGGAIYNSGNMNIYNCKFTNNQINAAAADQGEGGAIYNNKGNVYIENSLFESNQAISAWAMAGQGGAIWVSGGSLTIKESFFNNNQAVYTNGPNCHGGAIYSEGSTTVLITNTEFTNNNAYRYGGAIYTTGNTNAIINSSVFIGNTAEYGGAAYFNSGTNKVQYSYITENKATNTGQDFYISGPFLIGNYVTLDASNNFWGNNGAGATARISTYQKATVTVSNYYEISVNTNIANYTLSVGDSLPYKIIIYLNGTTNSAGSEFLPKIPVNLTYTTSHHNGSAIRYNWTVIANGYIGSILLQGFISTINMTPAANLNQLGGLTFITDSIRAYINNLEIIYQDGGVYGIYGRTTTIKGNIEDYDGHPITNGTITITIDGVGTFNLDTSQFINGLFTLTINNNFTGTKNTTIFYNNITLYTNATDTTSITVYAVSTNSTVVVPSGKVGSQSTISGVAIDGNNMPLAYVKLTVTVGGNDYNVTTDGSGAWSLTVIPGVSGNLLVTVNWVGNATHDGFTNSTIFVVANAGSNSTVVVPSGKVGSQSTIGGVATDGNNMPLAYVKLTVTVGGNDYNVTTDGSGAWSLTVIPGVSGNLLVTVNWVGNATHDGFTNSTIFVVVNAGSNSTVVASNGKVGQQSTISGVATDENGNPLVNVELTVSVNGNVQTVTTGADGAWSLNITPSVSGNLIVTVTWAGNATHDGFTNMSNFNVSKIHLNSTINVSSNVTVGEKIYITGVAIDENGNHVSNIQLNVTVGDNTFTVTTDTEGKWILQYIPSIIGKITFTVSSKGINTYYDFTNSTSFYSVPTPKPEPTPIPVPDDNNDTNNTNNYPVDTNLISAAMKKTGMPIISILLVILTGLSLAVRKKQ